MDERGDAIPLEPLVPDDVVNVKSMCADERGDKMEAEDDAIVVDSEVEWRLISRLSSSSGKISFAPPFLRAHTHMLWSCTQKSDALLRSSRSNSSRRRRSRKDVDIEV